MSKLDEAINALVDQKSLSLDTMQRVQKLKEQFTELESENERHKRRYEDCEKAGVSLTERLQTSESKLANCEQREKELKEREDKILDLEHKADKSAAVGAAYRECYQYLLGNTVIKERIQGTVPVAVDGGGAGMTGHVSSGQKTSETTTTKEGVKAGEEDAGAI